MDMDIIIIIITIIINRSQLIQNSIHALKTNKYQT
jgi:hypothetical protein